MYIFIDLDCEDIDFGHRDAQDQGCDYYTTYPQECEQHDQDYHSLGNSYTFFKAAQMCCSCGGGIKCKSLSLVNVEQLVL